MKKIDFHIHTVQSSSDAPFSFCMDKLLEYISSAKIDAIAITNHNLFDRAQFEIISANTTIDVYPGIEVDVDGTQILIVADKLDLSAFESQCLRVNAGCAANGSLTLDEFNLIFPDLSKYIAIPHYEKKPEIRTETLDQLLPHVTAGEVSSPKKFMYCQKGKDRLVPVYFSDCRIKADLKTLPVRQTYLDCADTRFSTIKHCLRDKNKVALSEHDGNRLFQVFDDGQSLSTGLNVVLGERSSGKSHTLDKISAQFSNVKHIKQFALVARDEDDDERRFNEALSNRQSLFSREYLAELQAVVNDVIEIDLGRDEKAAEHYLESLKKFARETENQDSFAKAKLYKEESYPAIDHKGLTDLIDSTKNLIRNEEFREIIDRHLPIDSLKALYVELMTLFGTKEEERRKKRWVNDVVVQVKSNLRIRSAATTISDFDPYLVVLNKRKIGKFRELVMLARRSREIMRRPLRGFEVVAKVGPFEGAQELKNASRSKVAFSAAFQHFDEPYTYLQMLKKLESPIQPADYFKFFVKIDYKILNTDGFEASGGERSEYFLLQEIEDARNYDMLLIDEPESSFDNIFLRTSVNEIIKDISRDMPVVVVTHNNTVGASIKPDYILCTKKEVRGDDIRWAIYSGFPTSAELSDVDGNKVKTIDVAMGCLEAGQDAYEERARGYEDLKN